MGAAQATAAAAAAVAGRPVPTPRDSKEPIRNGSLIALPGWLKFPTPVRGTCCAFLPEPTCVLQQEVRLALICQHTSAEPGLLVEPTNLRALVLLSCLSFPAVGCAAGPAARLDLVLPGGRAGGPGGAWGAARAAAVCGAAVKVRMYYQGPGARLGCCLAFSCLALVRLRDEELHPGGGLLRVG